MRLLNPLPCFINCKAANQAVNGHAIKYWNGACFDRFKLNDIWNIIIILCDGISDEKIRKKAITGVGH